MMARRRLALAGLALAVMAWLVGPARAAEREALVIGNGAYRAVPALDNPQRDAAAMAERLRGLGFAVQLLLDADASTLRRALRDFGERARGASIALVFYAGHGIQVPRIGDGAENYLVPVDAKLRDWRDAEEEAVGLGQVLARLEGAENRLVILDACRDNPFASTMRLQGGAARGAVGRGLARVENAAAGTLVAFATDPGATASDGEGRHSPFTQALLEHIATPGLELRAMLTRVRRDVLARTRDQANPQRPWNNDGLLQEVYLAGPPPGLAAAAAPAAPAARPVDPDTLFWRSVMDSSRAADFQAYLDRFPQGIFAGLARLRLEALRPPGPAPGPPGAATSPGTAPPVAAPQRDPAMAAIGPADRWTPGSREERARALALEAFATWSADDQSALAFVARAYAPRVSHWGSSLTLPELLRLKRSLAERWPQRRYVVRPGSVGVRCDQQAPICTVQGVVEWTMAAPAQAFRAGGVSTFRVAVSFAAPGGQIVEETGQVIERY